MTSTRQIWSNRANARLSTGPKTAKGRVRSARNPLRHGLSLPVLSDPTLSRDVAALAGQIAGTNAGPEIQQLARRVAEARSTYVAPALCAMISSPVRLPIRTLILGRTETKK
jgi:hypothetical protein